jgi:predicted flap endonuclease-1-like 5' DNA nuclease/uncharacterized membrane protein
MTVGPIQLIAVTFEDYKPKGHILQELNAQATAGTIRLVDAQLVRKTHDGHVLTAEITGLSEDEAAEFGAVIGGLIGAGAGAEGAETGSVSGALAAAEQSYGLSLQDVHRIANELEPGNAVGLLLIEHTWAIGFREAVHEASGKVVAQGFLTPETLLLVGRELEAQAEALRAIEISEAIQEEAAIEALEAIVISEAIQVEAAREAVDALLAAELIEEAAVEEAMAVVAASMAIEEAAVEQAEEVVAEAEAVEAAALERADEARQPVTTGSDTSHSLSYVEGIGPVYAQELKKAGIESTQELLEAGATPKGRADIAEASGISGKLILEWVNQIDLYRIQGVGSEYADLLEAAGVDTVPELAQRNPANLQKKLSEVNEEKHLVRHVPSLSSVEEWIRQAKNLPRKITY